MVQAFIQKWTFGNSRDAIRIWIRNSVREVAASMVQRAFRTYFARTLCDRIRAQHFAAGVIQRNFRCRAGIMLFARMVKRREAAALKLQGMWRGAQAKDRVRVLLLKAYRAERARLKEVREQQRAEAVVRAAVRLQGAARAWKARALVRSKFDALDAAEAAAAKAKADAREAERVKRVFRDTAQREFAAQVQRERDLKARALVDEEAKLRVRLRHRQRVLERWREEEREEEERNAEAEARFWAEFDAQWDQKIEECRAQTRKDHTRYLTYKPSGQGVTPAARREWQDENRAIKAAAREFKAQFKADGVSLSKTEALGKAKEANILAKIESAIAIVAEEREEERARIKRQRVGDTEERAQRKVVHDEAARLQLTVKLQRLYRTYKARQRLVKVAMKFIVRRFDPSSGRFYFSNLKTGQSSWKKPALFGCSEPEALDEWVRCVDPNGDTYLYNAHAEEMKWEE